MKRYNHMFTILGIMCVPFLPDSVGIPPVDLWKYQTTSSEIPNPKYFLVPLYWSRIWEWRWAGKRRCIWFTFHILLWPKTPWLDTYIPIQHELWPQGQLRWATNSNVGLSHRFRLFSVYIWFGHMRSKTCKNPLNKTFLFSKNIFPLFWNVLLCSFPNIT